MTRLRPSLCRLPRRLACPSARHQSSSSFPSSSSSSQPSSRPQHDPYALLSQPTWSIRSLLPNTTTSSSTSTSLPLQQPPLTASPPQPTDEPTITPSQLAHLLRLSALPQPSTPAETARMQQTLDAQLHFVRAIQRVDTRGVEPLAAIRDETPAGLREATIDVARVRDALAREEIHGRCKRPRMRHQLRRGAGGGGGQAVSGEGNSDGQTADEGVETWDVLGCAEEKVGRYFVVRSGKGVGQGDGAVGKMGTT